MGTVLPDSANPYTSLSINGLTYRYSIEKDTLDDAEVSVRNQDAINGGYVFEEIDDWSGRPGGTIQKYFRFGYIDSNRWGNGEIAVEGEATINDPLVVYNYKMDVDQQGLICSTNPLLDPSCPGFRDALLEYLKSLENANPDDPFYDEWVQAQLDQEVELEEEQQSQEQEEEEDSMEKRLGGNSTIEGIVDGQKQAEMLAALAQTPKIETYYTVEIPGGVYQETLQLEDKELSDNKRALRNLASDAKHKTMVRSQYEN